MGVGDETRRAHVLQLMTAMWLDKDMDINWVVVSDVSECFSHIWLGLSLRRTSTLSGRVIGTATQLVWTLCMFAMSIDLVYSSAMCNLTTQFQTPCHGMAQAT